MSVEERLARLEEKLAEKDERLAQLEATLEELKNVREIERLVGKYIYWLHIQDYENILEHVWAKKAPDVTLEASDSGLFKGQASVRRFYAADGVVGALSKIKCGFTMHMACSPIIEVAKDGKTAKSIWQSPGCAGDKWIWGTIIIDFIKEDGEWRFWHYNFTPFFRTPYNKGWIEAPAEGSLASDLADGPPTRWNPYNKEKMGQELFKHLPPAPEPYETYGSESEGND